MIRVRHGGATSAFPTPDRGIYHQIARQTGPTAYRDTILSTSQPTHLLARFLLRLKGGCGMGILSPALFGATRFRVAPSIRHGGHRPWAASIGKGSKRGALSLAALALTGCATPATRYVSVYCVSPSQLSEIQHAEPPKVGDKLTGNAQEDLKLIAGNDIQLRTYSDSLLGVLGGCTSNTGGSH